MLSSTIYALLKQWFCKCDSALTLSALLHCISMMRTGNGCPENLQKNKQEDQKEYTKRWEGRMEMIEKKNPKLTPSPSSFCGFSYRKSLPQNPASEQNGPFI